jgi:hypothetical protein
LNQQQSRFYAPFPLFLPLGSFLFRRIMPTDATAATFATFYGSEGRLGQAFLMDAGVNRSVQSVHHLVVSTGIPITAPQMRKQFGHAVTQTTAKAMKGTPTFQPPAELQITMQQQFQAWNVASPPVERILTLQRKPVGGIIAVVRHWNPDTSAFGPAVIRLLAAPALATLGDFPADTAPGLILSDVWNPDIVALILGDLPIAESCPMMAGTAGLSRDKGTISMAAILQDSAPVFIPDGLAVSAAVVQGDSSINRAIFLPELAHMPVGHCWPIAGLTLQDFTESIRLATASRTIVCGPFLALLRESAPAFQAWLDAVQANPGAFQVDSYYYQDVQQFFPDLANGKEPEAIVNLEGFSPLMDMRALSIWRCAQDIIYSVGPPTDVMHLKLLMANAVPALVASSYVGCNVTQSMCPNFPYHFRAHGGWPTMSSLLDDFTRDKTVSHVAKQHDVIKIDVQPKGLLTLQLLLTRDQQSSSRHAKNTSLSSHPTTSQPMDKVEILGSRILPFFGQQQGHHSERAPPPSFQVSVDEPGRREEMSPSKTLFSGNPWCGPTFQRSGLLSRLLPLQRQWIVVSAVFHNRVASTLVPTKELLRRLPVENFPFENGLRPRNRIANYVAPLS